jgi:hypothetical protein
MSALMNLPSLDTSRFTTGSLRVGESLKGPFVLTYLAVADQGATAELDNVNVHMPMAGQIYIGAGQTLTAVASHHDSLGLLLYSGLKA